MTTAAGGGIEHHPLGSFQRQRRQAWNMSSDARLGHGHANPFARIEHHHFRAATAKPGVRSRSQVKAPGESKCKRCNGHSSNDLQRGNTSAWGGRCVGPHQQCKRASADGQTNERGDPHAGRNRRIAGRIDDGGKFRQATKRKGDAGQPSNTS